jgi:hypothetical protein
MVRPPRGGRKVGVGIRRGERNHCGMGGRRLQNGEPDTTTVGGATVLIRSPFCRCGNVCSIC